MVPYHQMAISVREIDCRIFFEFVERGKTQIQLKPLNNSTKEKYNSLFSLQNFLCVYKL